MTVNTDHAGLWLGSVFLPRVDGLDISEHFKAGSLSQIFSGRDLERGLWNNSILAQSTAIYQTKENVWYQLHGSLNPIEQLQILGIDPLEPVKGLDEAYDYIAKHIRRWNSEELEMFQVKNGLPGSICYSPEKWRQTIMGKRLSSYPYINYKRQTYAVATPPVPFPESVQDKRPLVGVKVLEMVRIIAGPTVGVTLAAYGADVIRVNCSRLRDANVSNFTLSNHSRCNLA